MQEKLIVLAVYICAWGEKNLQLVDRKHGLQFSCTQTLVLFDISQELQRGFIGQSEDKLMHE